MAFPRTFDVPRTKTRLGSKGTIGSEKLFRQGDLCNDSSAGRFADTPKKSDRTESIFRMRSMVRA